MASKSSTMHRMMESLSKNANVKKVMNEFHRLSEDLKSRQAALHLDPGAKAALKKAKVRYQSLLKQIQKTQSRLKGELNDAASLFKKSAKEVRTDLEKFQTLASKKSGGLIPASKKKKAIRKKVAKVTKAATKKTPGRRGRPPGRKA